MHAAGTVCRYAITVRSESYYGPQLRGNNKNASCASGRVLRVLPLAAELAMLFGLQVWVVTESVSASDTAKALADIAHRS